MVEAIPDDARAFVRKYVRSMLQLEALLFLAREPEQWWSAGAVSRELRSSPDAAAVQLERLRELGLLESRAAPEEAFRFNPREPAHVAIVADLAVLHRERFHAVVDMIYARDRAQVFADAFKIKKTEDDDG
jgi:hypothetical protein